jgi:predicted Zn-dependent protease with MMP-like domain
MSFKPKTWKVLQQAVETGVSYGYRRAFKHTETPTEDEIKQAIEQAVLNEISEWFDIADEPASDEV